MRANQHVSLSAGPRGGGAPPSLFERTTNAPPSGPGGVSLGGVLILLFCLAAIAAGQFVARTRADDLDRWQYTYFGQRILAGDTIYTNLWDVKPPLHYWLNAAGLWLGGGDDTGVMALCATVALLSVLMLYAACRAFASPRAAGVTAAIGAVFLSHTYFFGGSNRSDSTELLLTLVAIAFVAHARAAQRSWLMLFAGVAAGAALGAKQTAVALLVAMLVDAVLRILLHRDNRGRALAELLLIVVGAGTGVAAWLWPTLSAADPRRVFDALIGFHRIHLESRDAGTLIPDLMPLRPLLTLLCVPLILAGVAVVHTIILAATTSRAERRDNAGYFVLMLLMWLLLGIVQVAVAPHEHPHYWLATLPPLLLLAGVTVGRMIGGDTFVDCVRFRPAVLVAAVALGILAWPALRVQRNAVIAAWASTKESREPSIAQRLAATDAVRTAPAGPALVWGYAPEAYLRLGRAPACRYVGTHFFFLPNGAGQPFFDDMMAQLNAAPPALIVLDRTLEEITSDAQHTGLDAAAFFQLLADYEVSEAVDGVSVYRRRVDQSSSM